MKLIFVNLSDFAFHSNEFEAGWDCLNFKFNLSQFKFQIM